jgi:hypothetical protein
MYISSHKVMGRTLLIIALVATAVLAYLLVKRQSASRTVSNQITPQATLNAASPNSNIQPPIVNSGEAISTLKNEGEAMGKASSGFPTVHKNQRSKLSFPPMPEVWLVYRDAVNPNSASANSEETRTITVQLSTKAKKVLRDHWKVACTYYYLTVIGRRDREGRIDLLAKMDTAGAWSVYKLTELAVDAPSGRRRITENEAVSLVKLVNTYAKNSIAPDINSIGT